MYKYIYSLQHIVNVNIDRREKLSGLPYPLDWSSAVDFTRHACYASMASGDYD
jgi:hypothetical protein